MIKDIVEPINVPKNYIAKLLQQLVKRHIVCSTKGPKGGVYLNGNNRNVTIIDIVIVIVSEERLLSCLLSLKECNSLNLCALHYLMFKKNK